MKMVCARRALGAVVVGVAGWLGSPAAAQVAPDPAAPAAVGPVGGRAIAPNAVPLLGTKEVRVTVSSARQLQTVLHLSEEVLSCEGPGVGSFNVRMTAEQVAALTQAGVPHQVVIEDLGLYVDAIMAENDRLRANPGDDPSWFIVYRTLDEINARLQVLANQFPNLATLTTIGNSIEGRPIRMIRITGPGSTATRPAFVINSTQHAREWVTPMTTMFMVDRLLETYGTDPQITLLVNKIDFHIIPVANPDGYLYTHTTQASWRKNRNTPPAGSTCYGVDMNRNWSVGYGNNNGSSPDPCSDTYRGTGAFSEPETTHLKGVIDALAAQGRFEVHFDVHSNGQLILSPWGYTTNPPPDLPMMDTLGAIIQGGMGSVRGTNYPYGPGSVLLYISSGASRDYGYGTFGAMTWTIEMDGASFMPAQTEILPLAEEGHEGMLALAMWYAVPIQLASAAPAFVPPNSPANVTVTITPSSAQYQAGSGRLFARVGSSGAFTQTTLAAAGGNNYQGTLPGAPCGSTIEYYFQAAASTGETVTFPEGGASAPLSTTAAELTEVLTDEFETAVAGWTVQNDASLTAGGWVRADPVGTTNAGAAAQPEDDHTTAPGVACYVTANGAVGGAAGSADVDGGPTRLLSPTLDLAAADGAVVAYWYWLYSVNGTPDPMEVHVSNNNGSTWTAVTTHASQSAWRTNSFAVQDFVPLTNQVRVRFTATDNPNNSLTEAAIDDFVVSTQGCPATCYADCNNSGSLTVADFGCFQGKYVLGDLYADCNASGTLTVADFGCFQGKYVLGCP
ncbi:MAG: M14 family zinc carboxypeptidase [Phycisphaerales bacterium]